MAIQYAVDTGLKAKKLSKKDMIKLVEHCLRKAGWR